MPHISQRQASFSRLAAGQISSRRSDIMLAATDTFCNHSRPEKAQVDQFRELFYSLISQTDEAAKRLIASALSKHYYAPRQILIYLALEEAAIAAPILAYSKALGQFDLLQIIEKTSNLHHRVIANRDDLGKTVVSKLIELDDYLVIRRLEDNPSVNVSKEASSKSSLEEIMELPEAETTDRKLDIASALDEMNAIIKYGRKSANAVQASEEAETLQSNIARISAVKPESNKIKLAMDELISLANKGRRLGSVEDLLSDLPGNAETDFSENLLNATIKKDRQDQIALVQKEFELSAKSASTVFEDRSGDTLSVCLKAADVETEIALQIISLSILNVGLSSHNTQRISKIYPALNQQACMETVKTWSTTNKRAPAYVPVTADVNLNDMRGTDTKPVSRNTMPGTGTRKLFGT